jgi:hypothetical protein
VKTFGWLATGAVLIFALNSHPGFLNLRLTGFVLIARGLAGLWLSIGRTGQARYAGHMRALVLRGREVAEVLAADLAPDEGTRVPLDDLLGARQRLTQCPQS